MKIGITPFIKENVAPPNTKNLSVFDSNGNKVGVVPLGNLKIKNVGTKLYSFGLISDLHLNITDDLKSSNSFDEALTFFEESGVAFCCHAGDITNIGFYYNRGDTEMYLNQFNEYKRICEKHPNLNVYGICGNHESYNADITENLTELEYYTEHGLYYSISQGNDLFIFIGQPTPKAINEEELQWLYETLEANINKRCFVFVHPMLRGDSGNPENVYNSHLFPANLEEVFKGLINHYKNVVVFHGHSHIDFNEQVNYKDTNYSKALGFHSVHVPSVSLGRKIENGVLGARTHNIRQGYIVDVYEKHIILNGYDFVNDKYSPIALYCLDTALQTVEANAYTDDTGTITT